MRSKGCGKKSSKGHICKGDNHANEWICEDCVKKELEDGTR